MSNLCHAVGTEPCLQHVRGEQLAHRAANRERGVCLDIVTQSYQGHNALIIWCINQLIRTPACPIATKGMNRRKREHIRDSIEFDQSPKPHYTVLVFLTVGGIEISQPWNTRGWLLLALPYIHDWLWCGLNFSLLMFMVINYGPSLCKRQDPKLCFYPKLNYLLFYSGFHLNKVT